TWLLRAATGPHGRGRTAMAYDSLRGVSILFGGTLGVSLGTGQDNDTWEWDGTSWTQRAVPGPGARRSHAMAYDTGRGVTVLFGGQDCCSGGAVFLSDTWEWDGVAWMLRATDGPSPRAWHSMAYDSERGVTVLFGGGDRQNSGGELGDTWEWDGQTWSLRTTSGPPPRRVQAMAYDSARRVTVMAARRNTEMPPHPWERNGSEWTQPTSPGPLPPAGHHLVYT